MIILLHKSITYKWPKGDDTTKNNESTEMVEIGNSFEKGKQYMRQSEKINV